MEADQVVEVAAVMKTDRLGAMLDDLLAQQIGLAIGEVAHLGADPARRHGANGHLGGLEGEPTQVNPHVLERQAGPQLLVAGARWERKSVRGEIDQRMRTSRASQRMAVADDGAVLWAKWGSLLAPALPFAQLGRW